MSNLKFNHDADYIFDAINGNATKGFEKFTALIKGNDRVTEAFEAAFKLIDAGDSDLVAFIMRCVMIEVHRFNYFVEKAEKKDLVERIFGSAIKKVKNVLGGKMPS